MKRLLALLCLFLLACSSGAGPGSASDAGSDPCEGISCSGHGTCVIEPGGPRCDCQPGYHAEGLACVEDGSTGPCFEVDCSGHGLCVDNEGTAECRCEAGFHAEGLACLPDSNDPCEGVSCSGHGVCVDAGGSPECRCEAGYHAEGLACVPDRDPCEGVSCSGHGECRDQDGQAECLCDEGYEPDGLECKETLCHCRERTQTHYAYCQYGLACNAASDCCPDADAIAPYVCNQDYPYRYACVDGYCQTLTCSADAHCQRYFQETRASNAGNWIDEGCKTNECAPFNRWCAIRQTCNAASDCCPDAEAIAPYVCMQDYPYVYACADGFCKNVGCTSASHCRRFEAQFPPAEGWVHGGCELHDDPCTGEPWYGQCRYNQACESVQDCCPENIGDYRCGFDYPYLYECRDGLCESPYCSSDAQCQAYFQRIDAASPGTWVNLGCVEY
ncbi:MAG: hypothetical protein JXR96_13550 [Deltaproteobacteria bacterium]|nr:hypothetical protein [Deltaproteobacteria bacterium]